MRKIATLLLCSLIALTVWADSSQDYEAALTAYSEENYEEAYIHLKNSLQDDPNNLAAKILMGKLLLRNGYLGEAEAELFEALQMGADINLVLKPLGDTLLLLRKYDELLAFGFEGRLTRQSRFERHLLHAAAKFKLDNVTEARQEYQSAISLFPANIEALNSLVSLELAQENFAAAESLINQAMKLDNNNPRLWQLKGRLLREQDNISESQSAMEYASELAPDDPLILRSLADIYINTKNYDAAARLVSTILDQTPDDPMALLLNSWLKTEQNNSADASQELEKLSATLSTLDEGALSKEPMLLYISALSAFAQNKLEQARSLLEQYLAKQPGHMVASLMLARTYLKLGKPKMAADALEPHAKNIAGNLDAAIMLSELYLRQNKAFKALEIHAMLERAYPGNKLVDLLDIKIMAARGKFQEAINAIDKSKYKSSDIAFILTKSLLLLEIGKIDEADYVADKLLEIAPDNPDLINFKAAVLIRKRQWDAALVLVEQTLKINPSHFSARYNRASIFVANGQFQQADDLLADLIEQQPDNVSALVLHARSQANTGQYDEAIENLERALELDIDNLQAFQILADIYAARNEFDRALRQLNNLIKHDDVKPRYLLQKTVLYLRKKDLVNAERQYRNIEEIAAEDPYVMRNLAKIRLDAGDLSGALDNIKQAEKLAPNDLPVGLDYIWTNIANKDYAAASIKLKFLKSRFAGNTRLIIAEGDLQNAKGETAGAAQSYLAAVEKVPGNRIALAKFYQLTVENKATELFEQSIPPLVEKYPDNYFQRNLLADFYLNHGKQELAREQYEKLLQTQNFPNRAFVLNNLANIYLKTDLGKAQTYITEAMQLAGNSPAIVDTYGWIKALLGNYKDALDILRRAYAMNSRDPAIQYHLAYTLIKLGRSSEAKNELLAALDSTIDFSERKDAEALLNSI